MIHHMLKHYLYSGFGIRLLCDFVLYLKRYEKEIDFSRIHQWCKASRISHLYEIILKTCRLYLDLPASIDPAINASPETSEAFLIRILEDGDMGTDVSQALVGSGSYRKINLLTYFREGHVQMKVRFPKAGHCPLLWPALWPATFFCFLKNTYTPGTRLSGRPLRISGRATMKTTLVRIFENSDS
ncbi:MAG: nucleotidyltransferase family protein [Lachnospiraceae bacterium]